MAGRKSEKGIINELEFDGKKLTDPTEIAEGFNKFSAEIGPKLAENISLILKTVILVSMNLSINLSQAALVFNR